MSTDSLKDYEIVIVKRATQLADRFASSADQPIDLAAWFSYFTYVTESSIPSNAFNSRILQV